MIKDEFIITKPVTNAIKTVFGQEKKNTPFVFRSIVPSKSVLEMLIFIVHPDWYLIHLSSKDEIYSL